MTTYGIYVDQVDTHVHLRFFVNHALAGRLALRYDEYIPFWGFFQMNPERKVNQYIVEFHDKIFWDKYNQEVKKDDRI